MIESLDSLATPSEAENTNILSVSNDCELLDVDALTNRIYELIEIALTSTNRETLTKAAKELKIYDSSLKVIKNLLSFTKLSKENIKAISQLRGLVKDIMGLKAHYEGRVVFNPQLILENSAKRKEWAASASTNVGLLSDSLEYLSKMIKAGHFSSYIGNFGEFCSTISSWVLNLDFLIHSL